MQRARAWWPCRASTRQGWRQLVATRQLQDDAVRSRRSCRGHDAVQVDSLLGERARAISPSESLPTLEFRTFDQERTEAPER